MYDSTAGEESARATARRVSARAAIAAAVPWLVALTAGGTGLGFGPSGAEAKTPGKTYCFLGKCHRVRTIEETRRVIGKRMVVRASFYGDARKDRFNPSNITSSGEYYRSDRPDNAASPIWPDGTLLLVWNPANKRTVVVRINNAGPYWGQRTLDLSRAAAMRLGFAHVGVATLQTKVLGAPTRSEATYRRGRKYPPAPGFLGIFQSIDTALVEAGRALGKALSPPAQAQGSTQVASADQAIARQVKTAKPASKSRTERAKVKTAARRAVASNEAGEAKKRRATRVARAETPAKSKKSSARAASARTAPASLNRGKRGNRGGDQQTQRRSQAVAEVRQEDDSASSSRNARRRAPAARAVAAARRGAKPAAAPNSVVANSESDALKYQYRPSRCYGWPNFCGREEG